MWRGQGGASGRNFKGAEGNKDDKYVHHCDCSKSFTDIHIF